MGTVAVIGSGSWGVSFAQHLAEVGHKVKVWSFKEEEKDDLNNNRKSVYLPDLTIHENVYCSNDFKEVVEDAEFIIHVTPSRVTRETFRKYNIEPKRIRFVYENISKDKVKSKIFY